MCRLKELWIRLRWFDGNLMDCYHCNLSVAAALLVASGCDGWPSNSSLQGLWFHSLCQWSSRSRSRAGTKQCFNMGFVVHLWPVWSANTQLWAFVDCKFEAVLRDFQHHWLGGTLLLPNSDCNFCGPCLSKSFRPFLLPSFPSKTFSAWILAVACSLERWLGNALHEQIS